MRIYLVQPTDSELASSDTTLTAQFAAANRQRVQFAADPTVADLVVLFEKFAFRCHRAGREYLSCDFLQRFAEKTLTINYDDYGRGFLPGLYTSLNTRNFDPQRHRAIGYPKTINSTAEVDAQVQPAALPSKLAGFRGSLRSHSVRRALYDALHGDSRFDILEVDQAFNSHDPAQKQGYCDGMLAAAFALCPRGWSPSTYRLFEAMSVGRCPVIISDLWVPIAGVDWSKCSIRVAERDIRRLPEVLEALAGQALELGQAARAAWQTYFAPTARFVNYLDQLADLVDNGGRLQSISQLRKTWKGRVFRRRNGWALDQRIAARMAGLLERS